MYKDRVITRLTDENSRFVDEIESLQRMLKNAKLSQTPKYKYIVNEEEYYAHFDDTDQDGRLILYDCATDGSDDISAVITSPKTVRIVKQPRS